MSPVLSGKALFHGFLVWLIPFLAAFPIFPLKAGHPLVFKALMSVILATVTVWAGRRYLSQVRAIGARTGLLLGVCWMGISILLDVPVFVLGFKMPPLTYLTEIAAAYLALPVITWGQASVLEHRFPSLLAAE